MLFGIWNQFFWLRRHHSTCCELENHDNEFRCVEQVSKYSQSIKKISKSNITTKCKVKSLSKQEQQDKERRRTNSSRFGYLILANSGLHLRRKSSINFSRFSKNNLISTYFSISSMNKRLKIFSHPKYL